MIIAAPASGQGKTVVTLGLLRAMARSGRTVRSAKSGPDYIDPAFHAAASGGPCVTLDSWAMPPEMLRARAAGPEPLIVEGAMGLLDGAAGSPVGGAGSVHSLAEALSLPVVLVIDVARMGQGVRAIVSGLLAESCVEIVGLILNRVGSSRHERMLRAALEGMPPVVGVVPRDDRMGLPTRHLGLVQAGEHPELDRFLEAAADVIAESVDLDRLQGLLRPLSSAGARAVAFAPLGQRVAVARDRAFAFAYDHMIENWRSAGADILPFSPLADEPPHEDADAVFLPGGYPELHAGQLASNASFKLGMQRAGLRNAFIYGECGGYMVLGDGLVDAEGQRHAMLGLLRLETSFADRKMSLGYRELVCDRPPLAGAFRGHEFHYATTVSANGEPLFRAQDAEGSDLPDMGLRLGSVCGSFAHLIAPVA